MPSRSRRKLSPNPNQNQNQNKKRSRIQKAEVRIRYARGWRRYYVESGAGSNAVVFLHGIPTNHALWLNTIAAMPPDIRCIAPDLTGFGLSDLPPDVDLSPLGQATQLVGFLDGIHVGSFTLVAHDFGALVAVEVLRIAPERVRGLVITNTSLRVRDWSGSGPNPLRLLALPFVGELAFGLARRWMLRLSFYPFISERRSLDDGLLEAFWVPFERGFSETLLRLYRSRRLGPRDQCRWQRALNEFEGLVTVAWGQRDPVFRPDRAAFIAGLAPQSRVVPFHNSNHFVPIDRPNALARLVGLQLRHTREDELR